MRTGACEWRHAWAWTRLPSQLSTDAQRRPNTYPDRYLFTFRYVCGRKHGFTADDLTDKMEGVSEDVLSACLAKFASEVADESTGATKYVVSKWHQDLLVSHIIVLYVSSRSRISAPAAVIGCAASDRTTRPIAACWRSHVRTRHRLLTPTRLRRCACTTTSR